MFAPASAARRVGYCIALFVLLIAGWPAPALGQALFNFYGPSLTSYEYAGVTGGQEVRPRFDQRGVGLDGSLRAGSLLGWHLAANPYPEGSVPAGKVGDINLSTGTYNPTFVFLTLPAPGMSARVEGCGWNLRQETSGGTRMDSNRYHGINFFDMAQPEIVLHDLDGNPATLDEGDLLYIVYGADRYLEFYRTVEDGTTFAGLNGAAGVVTYSDAAQDTYVYYDLKGTKTSFFGFDPPGHADGQLWKVVDPSGNSMYVGDSSSASTAVSGYTSKRPLYVYDGADNGRRQWKRSYSAHDGVTRLDSVIVETKTGGSWPGSPTGVVEVGRIEYEYYTGTDVNGDDGNLKTVTVTVPRSEGNEVKTWYFRFHTFNGVETAYDATDNPGYPNTLKLVLGPQGVLLNPGFLTDPDDDLKEHAIAYFKYPAGSDYRIAKAFFNGQCGCGGSSADGEYEFTYEDSSTYAGDIADTNYDTAWGKRTIVKRPDGTYVTHYFDEIAQGLSMVVTDSDPDGSPSLFWATQVIRNSNGQVTEIRSPASNTSYAHDDGSDDPLGTFSASASDGLITVFERDSVGVDSGLVQSVRWKKGTGGTEYYTSVTNHAIALKTFPDVNMFGTFAADTSPYKTEKTTGSLGSSGTDYDTTTFTKTMYSSPNELVLKKWVTTNPTVTSGNNGSNSATASARYIRADGTTAFTESADGIFTYTYFDAMGLLVKRIDDCQTNHGSDFGADDPNPAFGITESGSGLRVITTYTYDAQGRLDETTLPSGRVTKNYYTELDDGRLVTLSIPRYTAATAHGPVGYTVTNLAGRVEFQATLAVGSVPLTGGGSIPLASWIDESSGDEFSAVHSTLSASRANFQNVSMNVYADGGTRLIESRMYFDVPASGFGSAGSEYDKTTYAYDSMGRQIRMVAPDGTISRTDYDEPGRAIATWIGTDDTGLPGSTMAGTSNMVQTSETVYDGGNDGGNSHVTSRSTDPDGNWAGATDRRTTTYTPDVRGRVILVTSPQSPHAFMKYDNRGRTLATGLFSSVASIVVGTDDPTTETANRVGLSQTFYDERGQVWKSQRHNIDVSDGSDDDNLQTLTWYDAAGRTIKVDGEQLTKTFYRRLGQATNHFILASDNDSTYAHVVDVAGDTVLEERQTYFKDSGEGAGQPLMSVTIARLYGDTSTTTALDTDTDLSLVDYAGSKIKGRAQITMMFYDEWDRMEETAAVGTNGGSNIDRDSPGSITRSDTMLVTTTTFDNAGRVSQVTDPRGIVAVSEFDDAGRQITTIANYVNGTPSSDTGDDDVHTRITYDDGHMVKMHVDLNKNGSVDGNDEETEWTYGVPKGASAGDSKIASNSLLWKVTYPDSASGTDLVTFAYNSLGREIWKKDQAGSIIETMYDTAGRVTDKLATYIDTSADFDDAVKRISMTFNSLGMAELITQHDATSSGNVLDQIKNTYDGWGNHTQSEQDHDSIVGGSGVAAYTVSWSYAKATGGRNTIRRTGITIPGGGVGTTSYTYDYGAGSSIADNASRVHQIKTAGGTALVTYQYNGLNRVIGTTYDAVSAFTSLDGTSANTFTDLDNFDRIIGSAWTKDLSTDRDFYSVSIGYDRNSNITSITDNVLKNGVSGNRHYDVKYAIDGLNRVTQADEGTFSGSISNRSRQENWTLDQVGNWELNQVDLDGDLNFNEAGELNDDRTHNVVNELTARDTDDNGTNNLTLTYDAVGNMKSDGTPIRNEYDVFGRLRFIWSTSSFPGKLLAEYRYNGLGWRIMFHEDSNASGEADSSDKKYHLVYDESWRQVATYRDSDTGDDAKEQFLNHNAGLGGYGGASGGIGGYIDHVVCRLRDNTNGWTGAPDGTLEETIYYCQNWRADVSAILSVAGALVETSKNSAYGISDAAPTGDTDGDRDFDATDQANMTGAYEVRKDADLDGNVNATDSSYAYGIKSSYQTLGRGVLSSTAVANRKGYAGYETRINNTDHMIVRHRSLFASLGRWGSRDPLDYVDGPNQYNYAKANAIKNIDRTGLCACTANAGPTAVNGGIWEMPGIIGPIALYLCNEAVRTCLANDPRIREEMDRAMLCRRRAPTVVCGGARCTGNTQGFVCCDDPTVVHICFANGWPICDIIFHELIHVNQFCRMRPPCGANPCDVADDCQLCCMELEAYARQLYPFWCQMSPQQRQDAVPFVYNGDPCARCKVRNPTRHAAIMTVTSECWPQCNVQVPVVPD